MRSRDVRVAHVLGTMGQGGVPRVAYELLQRLPDRYERHLYCLTDRVRDVAARGRQVAALRAADVRVRLVADSRDTSAVVDRVAEWIATDGIDVVHTHSTRPNRYGRLAALRGGRPWVVAHYHNHYDDKWAVPEVLSLERALVPATDRLVACSRSVADHVVERLGVDPGTVRLLHNGVDAERYRGGQRMRLRAELGIRATTPVVGAIGRISRQKAPADVVRAVRAVADRRSDVVLLFAGGTDDPALEQEVRRLVASLGLGGQVRFLGYREDMADVYAALDVVVLASHWEGFGLVLVEAMAAGTPMVATRVGAIPEVVGARDPGGPAAELVPAGQPAALAAAVGALLDAPAASRALAARGEQRARAFSWDTAAGRLDDLYQDVLGTPKESS